MTEIENYILDQGPILSGRLSEYLVENFGLSEAAARKRIERLTSPIHKLTGLFSDKQSLLYHSDVYNSFEYFQKLLEALQHASKRSSAIITAINYHYGLVHKSELANYSFSPILKIKGHLIYDSLIQQLERINVLQEYDDLHFKLHPFIAEHIEPNFRHYRAISFSKQLLLHQFSTWSKNIGLTSFKTGINNSVVGGFQFAFTSPSYITGLVQYRDGEPKPGFVIVDILIGNKTRDGEIEFFVQKINAIKASNPSLKLFPVLILDGIGISGLNKLKKSGILIASVKELFGEKYLELLENLINTVTNAGTILKKNPDQYISLMNQLTKLVEGKTNNLRGDLFELAVGYYYGQFCKFLDIGKKILIEDEFKTLEIDVLALYENEIKIVECKGYNYPIDETYALKYLNERIPLIRKWLEKSYRNKSQTFEIWSTGGFAPDAITLLEKAKVNTKKYKIEYLNKHDILEKATQLQTNKFSEILRDYYFKEIV